MKGALTSATVTMTFLIAATLVWAGGMGGGLEGGMMGGGGHMMDSYGNGQMGSENYYNQDSAQRQHKNQRYN